MIITIGGIKGGSGKSLAATNLVVMRRAAGFDALLVDADDQRSASDFAAQRADLGHGELPCVQLAGRTVRDQVRQLAPRYADIIVDTGGRDTASQRAALTVSDLLLLPMQPGNFDLWTLEQVEGLVEEVRTVNPALRVLAYISRGLPTGSDNADAAALIRQSPVAGLAEDEAGPVTLTNRKAFNAAAGRGLSVVEPQPATSSERAGLAKAAAELRRLYAAAFDGAATAIRRHDDGATAA